MKKIFVIIVVQLLFISCATSQNKTIQNSKKKFIGEWKSYYSDNITFEYLKLTKNDGIKGIGKTINGKDTILSKDKSFLVITNWNVEDGKLILKTKHDLMYNPNGTYIIKNKSNDSITLFGDHLELGIYPSPLNKNSFTKTINYTNVKALKGEYGIKTEICLFDLKLFEFEKINENYIRAKYIGFDDIIPHIFGCENTQQFEFPSNYLDLPYELKLPKDFTSWSLGWGNNSLTISFRDKNDKISETSISINYDFDNEDKEYFFKRIQKGEEVENKIVYNEKDLYQFVNWQKKTSGKIFYKNNIYVSYYTFDKKKEKELKDCISSFRYKN